MAAVLKPVTGISGQRGGPLRKREWGWGRKKAYNRCHCFLPCHKNWEHFSSHKINSRKTFLCGIALALEKEKLPSSALQCESGEEYLSIFSLFYSCTCIDTLIDLFFFSGFFFFFSFLVRFPIYTLTVFFQQCWQWGSGCNTNSIPYSNVNENV